MMGNTRTRRPASDPRPARRSLAELTEAAGRAVDLRATAADGEVLEQIPIDHTWLQEAVKPEPPFKSSGACGRRVAERGSPLSLWPRWCD